MKKEKRDKVIAFRVSPSEMSKLREEAKVKGVNLNKLMREYIKVGERGEVKKETAVNKLIGKVKCPHCGKVVDWDKVKETKAFLSDYAIKICPYCGKWGYQLEAKGWVKYTGGVV